jgi:CheY-like chemotaxis protein
MKSSSIAYVVDDDPIYVYSLKRLIALGNFCDDVISFANGADALEGLKNANATGVQIPTIILLDINMPVMDGWEFLDEYERLHPQLKSNITIHMVSSSNDEAEITRAQTNSNIKSYVIKPVTKVKLAEIFGKPLVSA